MGNPMIERISFILMAKFAVRILSMFNQDAYNAALLDQGNIVPKRGNTKYVSLFLCSLDSSSNAPSPYCRGSWRISLTFACCSCPSGLRAT